MTNLEFANKLVYVAKKYKTLYVMGCFGAPLSDDNKVRYIKHNVYNAKPDRVRLIKSSDKFVFGFDCVCLIKGVLWGWIGDENDVYGGAKYLSNGVPDIGADEMIKRCNDVTTDFSTIEVGEAVWIKGHIGVYIGNGQVVECTPAFSDGVCISKLINVVGNGTGYRRRWTKHGKLPWIIYDEEKKSNVVEVRKARGVATSYYKGFSKNYEAKKDTSILHHGFRTANRMVSLMKGCIARCYGYYTVANEDGVRRKYMYVSAMVYNESVPVNYIGFVSFDDLKEC